MEQIRSNKQIKVDKIATNPVLMRYMYTKNKYFCKKQTTIHIPYFMKKHKVAAALAIIVILVIIVTSCSTTEDCAAYGEYKKYRVESR